jgi:tetratricopeptide (TPR) repeat protein
VGGSVAVGVFVALVAGWMAMRTLGIGPAASLMTAGKLGEREKIILTDFKGPAGDSLMGPTVTDAFRTDIGQSRNLSIVPVSSVREALRLMQRPLDAHVDLALAREIATRDGIKAVIDGEIVSLGGSYVLSARLVATQSGEELASFRETADQAKDIIPAISRISKELRARVGESMRAVQNARTLDKVTTASLPALQKYVAGNRAIEDEGDFPKGKALLEQAIALDTGFAMAYRKLAIELGNRGLDRERVDSLYRKALAHRDRLTESEQFIMVGSYYGMSGVMPEPEKSIPAYEALLDIDPKNTTALNNLAVQAAFLRQNAKADSLARRAIDLEPTTAVFFENAVANELGLGQLQRAESTLAVAKKSLSRHPDIAIFSENIAYARGQYETADSLMDSLARARANDPVIVSGAAIERARIAELRGRLATSLAHARVARQQRASLGNRQARVNALLDSAHVDIWYRGDKAHAVEVLQRATTMPLFDSLPPSSRPYLALARLYARADRPREAGAMMQSFERTPYAKSLNTAAERHATLGEIAMAEKRYDDAMKEFVASDMGYCLSCALPDIARAYDLSGKPDSAIAYFERYVGHAERGAELDAVYLAGAHKRLGELYEAKGDRARAATHLAAFVELWKDADPELQPKVKEARARLATLQRAEKH